MSYNGPVRLALRGDRVAASRYIRTARVLLGKLHEITRLSGATSGRRQYEIPNGSIELVLAGDIAAVTITVGSEQAGKLKVIEHFIVWARTEEAPPGIDAVHPQQMLRYEGEEDSWRTLFFDSEIEGYSDLARPKGTYKTDQGRVAFPDGLRHAGNVDWVNEAGIRVSWYGPSTRYFYDPFRQPRSQYGKHVFMLGQVLLDVEKYITDSAPDPAFDARYVMGAALNPALNELRVVLAQLPFGNTTDEHVPGNTVRFPETWPLADVPIVVCRFAVTQNLEAEQSMRFAVVPRSRQVLYSSTLRNPYNPWFFNASGNAAVSVGLPEIVFASFPAGTVPSESNPIWTVEIGEDDATLSVTNVGLGAVGTLATLAADFKGNTLVKLDVRRGPVGDASYEGFTYVMGGLEIPARECSYAAPPSTTIKSVTENYIQHADLRENELVILRAHVVQNLGTATTLVAEAGVDIWVNGLRTGSHALDLFDILGNGVPGQYVSANEDWRGITAPVGLSPQFALYGAVGGLDFITVFIRWTGTHFGIRYMGYPTDEYFSQMAVYVTGPGGPSIPMTIHCSGGFDSHLADFDGHYIGTGCATYDGITVFSGPAVRSESGESISIVASPEPGVTLADLTGVDGTKVRYHPVWLLGALPSQEVQ